MGTKPELNQAVLKLTLMGNGPEHPNPIALDLVYDRQFCYFDGAPPHPLSIVISDPSDSLSENTAFKFSSVVVDEDGFLTLNYKEKP